MSYTFSLRGSSEGQRREVWTTTNSTTHQPAKSPTPPPHSLDRLSRGEQESRDWVLLNKARKKKKNSTSVSFLDVFSMCSCAVLGFELEETHYSWLIIAAMIRYRTFWGSLVDRRTSCQRTLTRMCLRTHILNRHFGPECHRRMCRGETSPNTTINSHEDKRSRQLWHSRCQCCCST